MLAARKKGPPEIAFQPGPDGDAARKEYGDWYTETMKREWYSTGIHLGFNYSHSPVVYSDDTPAPPDEVSDYVQTARPGHRAPHAWLKDGRSTLDLFGRSFVLLCFSVPATVGDRFAAEARVRGVPLLLIELSDETKIRELYGANYVLVRPDGHVAWRGNAHPDSVGHVIDVVRGLAEQRAGARLAGRDHQFVKEQAIPAGSSQ
jgi:hypothetical protein